MSGPDPFSDVLAEQAYGPIYSAQYRDAHKSARANELGHRLGIPADIVDSDIPNMMAADRLNRAITEARNNAAYARIMANTRLAASGIDDPALPKVAKAAADHAHFIDFNSAPSKIGPFFGTFANIGYGIESAIGDFGSGAIHILSGMSGVAHGIDENEPGTLASTTPLGLAMHLFGKSHGAFKAAADSSQYETSNRNFNDVLSGVQSAPAMATAIFGPEVPTGIFASEGFSDAYDEGRSAGLTPGRSALYGAGDAAIQAGTAFLPEKYLGGVLSGKGGLGKTVAAGVGLNEVMTALQGLNHWYFIDKPQGVTFDQFVATLPDQMRSSFVSTVAALGLTAGAGHVVSRLAGHATDTAAAQSVDSVMDAAAKSTTRTANPTDFEAAMNQLVGDSNASDLYVPADKVLDLFQLGTDGRQRDLRSDPFWGQYAGQVEEAAQLGGDVVVPLSAAATHLAGTTDWAAIRDYARARPGGASLAEAREAQSPEALEAMASEVAQHIDERVPQLRATALARPVADVLGYKGEQAESAAHLLGAGLARAYALEKARAEAAGRPAPTMEDFAAEWLPKAEKTTQAAYDASRAARDGVTAEAAQAFNQEIDRQPEAARPVVADSATLAGHNSNSPYMVVREPRNEGETQSEPAASQEADAGSAEGEPATRPVGENPPQRTEGGEEQLELFPGADFGVDPKFFGSEIDVDGVSRHTVNADGNPIAGTRQAIENFWRWFGDSQAVDHEGKPIVFYHGTRASEQFEMFDTRANTFFFALDRGTAESFAGTGPDNPGHVIAAYLRVTNPDRYDAEGRMWDAVVEGDWDYRDIEDARDAYVKDEMAKFEPSGQVVPTHDGKGQWAVNSPYFDITETFDTEREANDRLKELQDDEREREEEKLRGVETWELQDLEYLTREGIDFSTDQLASEAIGSHDAVWIDDVDEGSGPTTVVIVLGNAHDIKSADKNLGTFDPENPSMLYDTQRRGNISIARDSEGLMTNAVIRAFEHADFSTAIHETGHFFLEDLKRRALSEGATEQEKADWQTVKDWMGETGHAVEGEAVPEAAHEQWARGFERYIYEGKAPSAGLKAVFAKMRDFMVALYRSIRSFNSPISPEIRQVMDRLLASDDEINARRQELRLGDQALHDLMSAEEQSRYAELGDQARETARDTLYDRVLSTLRAERTREVARRKAEIRQAITDDVDQQPIFRALKMLRSGVARDDGSTERVTLPRQWLVDNYGEDIIGRLPKGVPPIVDDAHGVDPDGLARDAGFDSADQMVQKLLAHEEERQKLKLGKDDRSPRRALIEKMTEQRLKNEIGDPYANLEEEADAALANERQADRLSLELRALSRKSGGKAPVPWKLARDWARAHVRTQSSKDAISGAAVQMYSRTAAKAAQRVEEALAGGDYEAAFTAKQQQVLNLALMSEAKSAKDDVDSAVKRLRNVARKKTIASVDQDYLDQAHRLLENVDMKNRPAKAVDKRMAFEAWHAKQVEMDIDPVVPPEYQSILGQTHWSRLSINDLLDLDEAVKQIVKLGRLKQELKDGRRKRDYNEAVAEMQDYGGRVPPRKARGGTTDPRKSPVGRAASRLRSIDAAMVKTEQLAIWMDNHDPNGPWQRMLYRPFADAQGRQSDMMRQYGRDVNALIKAYPKASLRGLTRAVDTPELVIRNRNHLADGEPFKGTKDQVLMMAMNWGNLGNRQRLLDGFGWNENAVASVFDRVLTKDDWDLVQGVWDTVDKLWPDVAKLEREVNGAEPEKVEAAEVPTPYGTYRGGYFPIVYDPMQTTHTAQAAEDKMAPSGGWWTISTRSSATKERAEQVKGRPLLLSLGVITHHMNEVIHDITHRQAVNQAKKLLGDERVAASINKAMGPEYLKAARAWVENVARPNAAYSRSNPAVVALARYLNKAVTTIGLGFRVTVSLKQLMGIPFSAKDLGAGHLVKGMGIVLANPVGAYREMAERSAEMRARSDHLDASLDDMRNDLASGKLRAIGPRGITKYAFKGIAYMDVISRTTVWTSAYNKALSEGMSEDDAVAYGDKIVRQSHGIGFQKDRAAIQYDHPFARALWPFFSYMNALYNAQRDVGHRFARAETGGDYADAARRAWWVFVVPSLLSALLFENGPEDKDGNGVSVGDWAQYLGVQAILGNAESLPLFGNAATAIGRGYSYRAISYQQIGDDIAKGWKQDESIRKGDSDLSGSAIHNTLEAVGAITAKPLGQIGATAGGLYDYANGTADPESVGDWYYLLTRGSIPNAPTAPERLAGRKE